MARGQPPNKQKRNGKPGQTIRLGSFNVALPGGLRVSGTGVIGIIGLLLAATIGGWVVLFDTEKLAAAVIHAEPVQTPGTNGNPFMPPAGDDQRGVTPPPRTGGTFDGNTSGLYGGTLNNSVCDRQAVIKFLQAHPDKGAAWARVQGIRQADLPRYISGLTPVFLRSDTAVTNHGFRDGRETILHSVLQAGTAVLVDKYGVPRARCYCGNPLTPASPPATKQYVGTTWSGFSTASITTIKLAAAEIREFTLVNPYTNEIIYRPAGTAGEQDRPQTPPATSTPETPPADPPETPEPEAPRPPSVPTPVQPEQPESPEPHVEPTVQPVNEPPNIVQVETYQEGELVYFSLSFRDVNDDAEGFGFRGTHGSDWGEETQSFSNTSYGRVSSEKVDYPFNLGCGTESEYESDVEAWIYDSTGLQSEAVTVHLSCEPGGVG